MNWIFLAFIPPLLWGISNFIDKYLLSEYFKNKGVGTLLIFSSLIGTVLLPIIFLIDQDVINIPLRDGALIIANGIMFVFAYFPYFKALEKGEASTVASLFQLMPVFGYFLGLLVLGEQLAVVQLLACVLIILGGLILTLDINKKIPRVRMKIFLLMSLSSLMLAMSSVIFKFIAIEHNFLTTTFWEYVGLTIAAGMFLSIKTYRKEFFEVINQNKARFISLNFLNEFINIFGRILATFIAMSAPVVIIMVFNSFMPLYLFLIGIAITLFFPKLGRESLLKKHLFQKIISISIMLIGAYLLNL